MAEGVQEGEGLRLAFTGERASADRPERSRWRSSGIGGILAVWLFGCGEGEMLRLDSNDGSAPPALHPAESLDECFDVRWQDKDIRTWTVRSLDATARVRVRLTTRELASEIQSGVYRLLRFGLAFGSKVVCVASPAGLSYKSTHHNWLDVATATFPSGLLVLRRYVSQFFLTGFEGGGYAKDSEIEMTAEGCTLPPHQPTGYSCSGN